MRHERTESLAIVLGAIGLLSIAAVALAAEPVAKPTVGPEEVPAGDAQPATSKEKGEPVGESGEKKDVTKSDPAKVTKVDDTATTPKKKPLIAPPSLLSRAPIVPPATAPGLGKPNLNRIKLEQIQRLPGVGIVWAPRILAGRPYRTFGDLARYGVPFTTIDALSREVELGPRAP